MLVVVVAYSGGGYGYGCSCSDGCGCGYGCSNFQKMLTDNGVSLVAKLPNYHHRSTRSRFTKSACMSKNPEWQKDYKHTGPTLERKLAHLKRRKHGGFKVHAKTYTYVSAPSNTSRPSSASTTTTALHDHTSQQQPNQKKLPYTQPNHHPHTNHPYTKHTTPTHLKLNTTNQIQH